MRPSRSCFALVIFVIVSGCQVQEPQAGSPPGGGSVTVWTEITELFMEYPALVVGKDVRLAVHLSRMDDFKAVTSGQIRLDFSGSDGSAAVATADSPSSPGIFRPTVRFERAGAYQATLVLTGPVRDTIAAGEVTVYASEGEIPEEKEGAAGEELISFLKEQQWRIDFRTEPVRREKIAPSIHAAGEIIPALNREAIVAAPFTGFVPAGEGDPLPLPGTTVERGRTLAVMIPSAETPGGSEDFNSRSTDALTERDLAARDFERAKRLYAIEGISEKEYLEAEAHLRRAEATVSAMGSAALPAPDSTGVPTGGRFLLQAPISGTITAVHAVPGKQAEAGEPLFHVIDLSSVWVRVNVPVSEIARVGRPSMAWMSVSGLDAPVTLSKADGRLVSVGSAVEAGTRSVPVIFEVRNPDRRLRVGMNGEVYISTSEPRPGLVVPETALFEEEGRYSVYVHVEGEAFARREVQIGAREMDRVEVLSGLAESERVVTVGAYQVRLASLSSQLPAHGHEH